MNAKITIALENIREGNLDELYYQLSLKMDNYGAAMDIKKEGFN